MKEVNFKRVSIKNFLSIGDDPVDIKFESGIHIITGVNKDKEDSQNGVGKSTISDAIFFAIFGSPLRPIKKDVIANWINKKECGVSIVFDVIDEGQTNEYVLLRSLNPSRVQLIKNGEDITRTIGKTNETVHEILGTTAEIFEQTVIMCLNQTEPFLSKTPAVKRKFIEDIFKLEIFGNMTQVIRNDFNEAKRLYDTEEEKIIDLNTNILLHKKQQQEQIKNKKARIDELESRKTSVLEDINHIKLEIIEIQNNTIPTEDTEDILLQKIKTLKDKEKEIIEIDKLHIKSLTANQTIILNIKSKIKELEILSDGICVYCKQPFSVSNIQEKTNLIIKYKDEIKECDKILAETENKSILLHKHKTSIEDLIEELNQKYEAIVKQKHRLFKLDSELKQYENWLSHTIKDVEKVNQESDSFENIIFELTARRDVLLENSKNHKNLMELIESSKFVVSDEGVKRIIVKKMLTMLNGRLNNYLKQLDANCTCMFNEYFDEVIVNNRGCECSYFNFSGGERKRIDLAMLFTFMDIRRMQSNVSINMGIYDELLDTSLDLKGIELTLNILKDRVSNNKEAVYIISHKNEAVKHATGDIIYLEKENNITKRKSYEQFTTNVTI